MALHALVVAALALATGFWGTALTGLLRLAWEIDRRGLRLDGRLDAAAGPWPRVSVIVPARDEEAAIETAVRSMLAQDYPDLEVVAVDDRSTDRTGALLDRLAAAEPRLAVEHVRALPDGWLGKNHACHVGAGRATGEWLLFSDGDVVLSPRVLRRTVAFARAHRLAHAVALPVFRTEGFLESAFVSLFGVYIALQLRLWELSRPGTRAFVGSGAFSLVRRDAYRAIGGHEALRFEVVDDVKLGLLLRRRGFPQAAADSDGGVSVRWQPGFVPTLRGLLKNAFAGVEWSWLKLLGVCAGLLGVSVLPFVAPFLDRSPEALALAGVCAASALAAHAGSARRFSGGSGAEALLHPLMAALFVGVMLRSALGAAWRGGIVWRGTLYPLARLRAGCVRESDYPASAAVGWNGA